MRVDDIPLPSSISGEAKAFLESQAPLERLSMAPEAIAASRLERG